MEDQPADSGDLTTGARRRHRMPLRKELAGSGEDAEDTSTEAEKLTEVAEAVAPAAPRRRLGLFRRRSKPAGPESLPAPAVGPEPEPQPRTPVGKAARGAKHVAEPHVVAEQPVDDGNEVADAPQEDPVLVPHRPAGKRMLTAAAVAGVVFVGAAAFGGATLQPYLADRALVRTKLDIAKTAANAISTLWTYTPDNMDGLPDRAASYLGGDFANEYRKYIDAIVATNKQAQVTNTTQVMGAAVETVTPNEATALVYTNSVATSPGSKNIPSLRYLSYRLTMQRHDAKWLITRMSTVTSFDLTPQL